MGCPVLAIGRPITLGKIIAPGRYLGHVHKTAAIVVIYSSLMQLDTFM